MAFAAREYGDIDLFGLKRHVEAVGEIFRDLGYVGNRHVAMATGSGLLQFFEDAALAPASAHRRAHALVRRDRGANPVGARRT